MMVYDLKSPRALSSAARDATAQGPAWGILNHLDPSVSVTNLYIGSSAGTISTKIRY